MPGLITITFKSDVSEELRESFYKKMEKACMIPAVKRKGGEISMIENRILLRILFYPLAIFTAGVRVMNEGYGNIAEEILVEEIGENHD